MLKCCTLLHTILVTLKEKAHVGGEIHKITTVVKGFHLRDYGLTHYADLLHALLMTEANRSTSPSKIGLFYYLSFSILILFGHAHRFHRYFSPVTIWHQVLGINKKREK